MSENRLSGCWESGSEIHSSPRAFTLIKYDLKKYFYERGGKCSSLLLSIILNLNTNPPHCTVFIFIPLQAIVILNKLFARNSHFLYFSRILAFVVEIPSHV